MNRHELNFNLPTTHKQGQLEEKF